MRYGKNKYAKYGKSAACAWISVMISWRLCSCVGGCVTDETGDSLSFCVHP